MAISSRWHFLMQNYTIAQSKVDIADDMKIPGLSLQEGFINELLKGAIYSS